MMNVKGDLSDGRGAGIDNLLYSADAEFSCFADLAITSPGEYYKPGEGSLIQAVFDWRAFERSEEKIVQDAIAQIHDLFPSSKQLKCTWSSVVKLGQSLYREIPGQDKYRPSQVWAPFLGASSWASAPSLSSSKIFPPGLRLCTTGNSNRKFLPCGELHISGLHRLYGGALLRGNTRLFGCHWGFHELLLCSDISNHLS